MTELDIARFSQDERELERIQAAALDEAQRLGATQAEAMISLDSGLDVTVRLGEVETLERTRDRGLGVTVYFGKRKGNASTADLSPEAVRETVHAACDIARYTEEDPAAGLADAGLMATEFPDLDLWHPWQIELESAIETAKACEAAARAVDKRITNSDGASLNTHASIRVYANTHGFVGSHRGTSHSISCMVLADEGRGMQRDYWYDVKRDATDLMSVNDIGRIAGERSIARLGGQRLSTRKAPVMFAADVAKSLIGHFLGAIRGTSQYRESSFLLNAAGEKVFPDFLSISEHPHLPKGLASSAFDEEGVATRERDLVANGVLQAYILSSYSARRLGLQSTGNAGGVRNVQVKSGGKNFAALCKEMDTGLLVTELMGQGVNGVTGDYSRGAAGFWVENGQIAYPVEEITIAGNLREMYRRLVAVGNDVDTRSNIRTGSILLESMTIAGE